MFNKPQGCVTAKTDVGHKTVMDYFPDEIKEKFHPVGRLDKNTEGLLIITNDGMLTKKLCDPAEKKEKVYFLWAIGEMNEDKIQKIREGLFIKHREEPCEKADLKVDRTDLLYNISGHFSKEHRAKLMKNKNIPVFSCFITITEGKKHQVKRMMKALGCTVVYLKRIKIAGVCLDENLMPGMFREMTDCEMKILEG